MQEVTAFVGAASNKHTRYAAQKLLAVLEAFGAAIICRRLARASG